MRAMHLDCVKRDLAEWTIVDNEKAIKAFVRTLNDSQEELLQSAGRLILFAHSVALVIAHKWDDFA